MDKLNDFKNNVKNNKVLSYVIGGLLALLGILVIIFPAFWVKFFVVIFGLGAIAYGVYIFMPVRSLENSRFKKMILIKACVSVVFGLLSVIIPLAVATAAWKVIVYLFALSLIAMSALGFYSATIASYEGVLRKRNIIENLLLLLAAIVLFLISPEKLGTAIIRIVGICALLAGLAWLVFTFFAKPVEIIVSEADVTIVDDDSENQ